MNELQGKRVAMVLTDGVEQVEYTKPREFLEQQGAKPVLVSPKPVGSEVQGFNHLQPGQKFKVEMNVKDAKPEDFDLLVLPGGVANPDMLRLSEETIHFIRRYGESGKPIAAICHGPWTLINAGLARDKRMTSWPSLQTDLRNAGAEWVDEPVVRDGRLVTSRKPDDIPQFDQGILELMKDSRESSPKARARH